MLWGDRINDVKIGEEDNIKGNFEFYFEIHLSSSKGITFQHLKALSYNLHNFYIF